MTVWSFSLSETIARHASDERTSVGRKCLRAKVVLPEPLGPIRTTRLRLGILMCIGGGLDTSSRTVEDRHLRGRPERVVLRTNGQELDGVAVQGSDTPGPGAKLVASPFESMVRVPQFFASDVLPGDIVFAVGGGEHDGRRAGELEDGSFEGAKPGRIEVLDHLDRVRLRRSLRGGDRGT